MILCEEGGIFMKKILTVFKTKGTKSESNQSARSELKLLDGVNKVSFKK